MKSKAFPIATIVLAFMLVVTLPVAGIAQGMGSRTGSGMGGNSTSSIIGSMLGTGASDVLNGAAMGAQPASVTVGEDGNIYVTSRVLPATAAVSMMAAGSKTKLSSFNGTTGTLRWSVVLDEDWAGKPVQGPDGTLFLVGMDPKDLGLNLLLGKLPGAAADAKLYILDSANGKTVKVVTLTGEAASQPTIHGTASDYRVYLVSYDVSYTLDTSGKIKSVQRTSNFYAFSPGGKELFKISLDK
jgi:hypothetical protein